MRKEKSSSKEGEKKRTIIILLSHFKDKTKEMILPRE